jgi:hypothetical protein
MPQNQNMHRNVFFKDCSKVPEAPFSAIDSDHPEDLWNWMDGQRKVGNELLAISHNANLSNGIMFPIEVDSKGKPIDAAWAQQRMTNEPLIELKQVKGASETHPDLSPNDEFANFERWDKGNLDLSELKTPEMLQYEYARSGLKLGLKLEQELGTNPYKFGMIGSTDAHTGLATADEDNYFGKTSAMEPSPERTSHVFVKAEKATIYDWETSASGYAAVWATENTREALFDAMERRETYATTGPRMLVRFFGGWDFEAADAQSRSPAVAGYQKGVPMGGDLRNAPPGRAPGFLVAALKDPIGANLDRIQIVKGWLTGDGRLEEKIYDVVWADADRRKPGADGKLPRSAIPSTWRMPSGPTPSAIRS